MELLLIFLLAIIQLSHQRSTPEADTYKAGVVEYAASDFNKTNSPISKNGERYAAFIKKAGSLGVDIIVFPEDGLTSVSLPVREKMNEWSTLIPLDYNPCSQEKIPVHEALKTISCAAKDALVYVVINIAEKVPCDGDKCPKDGKFFYNSQAVFDRNGKIVAKYRKSHLFYEPQFNYPSIPEVVTFDTDFNVTFGTFICFDIFFKEPATTLTRIHNVTDIVYSAAWFSELPFLTAIEAHGGWAYSEDVNLLASGYNRPEFSNSGSGIYLGRSGKSKVVIGKSGDELIIVDVPKKNRKLLTASIRRELNNEKTKVVMEEHVHDELRRKREANGTTDFALWQDNLKAYESTGINFNVSKSQKICQNDFCCDFTIEASNIDNTSIYKMLVMNGKRYFGEAPVAGVQACGLVLCANNSINSCGLRLKSETIFSSVKITATFSHPEDILIMPSSTDINILPLNWTYNETMENKKIHIVASLNEPSKNVLTLGLYARRFDRDILPVEKLASSMNWGMQLGIIIVFVVIATSCYVWYRKRLNSSRKNEEVHANASYETLGDS